MDLDRGYTGDPVRGFPLLFSHCPADIPFHPEFFLARMHYGSGAAGNIPAPAGIRGILKK